MAWTIPPTPGARYRIAIELTDPTTDPLTPLSTKEYRLAVASDPLARLDPVSRTNFPR